ncbi:MAG: DMT family transporter [Emcibacter sp.]|nr:DMT family transporter [Emcibacter sp.]
MKILTRSPLSSATLYMLLYTLTFSALWACIRHLSSDIHPLVLVFFRTFFGMIFILPVLLKIKLPAFSSGLYPLYFLRGVFNITSVIGAFITLSYIPMADAVAFSYIAPIFATILAVFILKEKIGKHRIFAILIAFIGVIILIRPGFQVINVGIVTALGAAVCFAATLICVKILTRYESPTIVSLMAFIIGIPISFIAALFYWTWPTGDQWIYIIAIGLLSASAHISLAKALSKAELSAIMPLDFTRIIFAAILGISLFGDPFNIMTFIGGGIILASAAYTAYREKKMTLSNIKIYPENS